MRIAVCDDQPEFLERLKGYLGRYEDERRLGINILTFERGEDLLNFYGENQNIDLIILDILMDDMDGMQVAKKIREYGSRTKIAFLSSTEKYAIQGYVVNACRYWVKPISYELLSGELDLIFEQIKDEQKLYFFEKSGTSIKKIYFNDIKYIETVQRKTMLHMINENIVTNSNMKTYEVMLGEGFFRCHAAYIVNMSYIQEVNGLEIVLKNQEKIYMSKNKKKEFCKRFAQFIGGMLRV